MSVLNWFLGSFAVAAQVPFGRPGALAVAHFDHITLGWVTAAFFIWPFFVSRTVLRAGSRVSWIPRVERTDWIGWLQRAALLVLTGVVMLIPFVGLGFAVGISLCSFERGAKLWKLKLDWIPTLIIATCSAISVPLYGHAADHISLTSTEQSLAPIATFALGVVMVIAHWQGLDRRLFSWLEPKVGRVVLRARSALRPAKQVSAAS
jgi:hypothetical protein